MIRGPFQSQTELIIAIHEMKSFDLLTQSNHYLMKRDERLDSKAALEAKDTDEVSCRRR